MEISWVVHSAVRWAVPKAADSAARLVVKSDQSVAEMAADWVVPSAGRSVVQSAVLVAVLAAHSAVLTRPFFFYKNFVEFYNYGFENDHFSLGICYFSTKFRFQISEKKVWNDTAIKFRFFP